LSLALIYAFEEKRTLFGWDDVRTAIANVESGLAEVVEYTDRDKLGVSRHELGHAVAAKFFEPDKGMARLSIRMRGGSLGHFYNVDQEEEFLKVRSQLRGRLCVMLGAIASERVFYNENSAGVSNDLVQATNMAARMIGEYGMGPELDLLPPMDQKAVSIGQYLISLAEAIQSFPGADSAIGSILRSNHRAVAQVMGKAYIDVWRTMKYNQQAIDDAAEILMLKGELVGNEVDALLNLVNLKEPDSSFEEYPDNVAEIYKEK
jgi:cell division protease FtsH